MPEPIEPSDLELQILSLLWARGPLTARQVLEWIPDGKKRAYTSILSVMQVMEKKGLLTHRADGQTHVYRPRVARARVLGRMLGRIVNHVFGGDPSAAVQSLLQQTPISPQELAQIQRIVEEHAAEIEGRAQENGGNKMMQIFNQAAHLRWENLVLAMIHSLWEGALIAGMLWIFLRLVPARRANARYLASIASLGAIIFAGMITWSVLERREARSPAVSVEARATIADLTDEMNSATAAPPPVTGNLNGSATKETIPWTTLAGWAWASGAAAMLLRTVVRAARAQHWAVEGEILRDGPLQAAVAQMARRMKIGRSIRVIAHARSMVPAVVGFVWPTILLPAAILSELPPAQLEMVLAHELAHVRRWDYLANFWQQIVEALLFFNPAVWWVSHQARVEREACCDACAVRITGAATEAARTLATFAERISTGWMRPLTAVAISGPDSGSLLNRIRRIVRPDDRPALSAPWYPAGGAMILGLIFLGLLRAGADVAVTTAQAILTPAQRVEAIAQLQNEHAPAVSDQNIKFVFRGRVTTADESPIPAKSYISILSSSGHSAVGQSFEIQSDGTFFGNVSAGQVQAVVAIDGFAPNVDGPFNTDGNKELPEINLVVQRGFTSQLRVVNAAGKPIAGAEINKVYVRGFNVGQQKGETDANGIIALEHCTDAIAAQIDVTASGYEFERQGITLSASAPSEIKLTDSRPTLGTVVDTQTGQPIPNAQIKLLERKGFADMEWNPYEYDKLNAPVLMATSDENGKFDLNELRVDSHYAFWVVASGHGGEVINEVSAGQKDLIWKLGPPRVIHGKITGDLSELEVAIRGSNRGSPVIQYRYAFMRPNQNWGGSNDLPVTIADGVGSFELDDPAPGTVDFIFKKQAVHVDVNNIPPLVEIDLDKPTQTTSHSENETRAVVFKFDLPKDAPPPRGKLVVQCQDPYQNMSHREELPIINGEVRAQIPAPYKLSYQGELLLGYWIADRYAIEIPKSDGEFVIDIPALPAGAVEGNILGSDGKPYSSYFFVSTQEIIKSPAMGSQGLSTQAFNSQDNSGRFLISSLPLGGKYRFVAGADARLVVSDEVSLDARSPIQDIKLEFPEGKPLTVKVLDADGQPKGGANVTLFLQMPQGGFSGGPKTTSRDGTFTFEHVNPDIDGNYSVEIRPGSDYAGQTVPVHFDDKPVTITLKKGLTFHGQVLNATTGLPIAKAKVRVWPMLGGQNLEATTDDSGNFSFFNLDSVDYSVAVENFEPEGSVEVRQPDGKIGITYPNEYHLRQIHGGRDTEATIRIRPYPN